MTIGIFGFNCKKLIRKASRRRRVEKKFLTSPVILSVSEESMRSFTFVQDDGRCFADAQHDEFAGEPPTLRQTHRHYGEGKDSLPSRGEVKITVSSGGNAV